jgi:hypothetical protein
MSAKLQAIVARLDISAEERAELTREMERAGLKCECQEGLWVRVEVREAPVPVPLILGPDHVIEPHMSARVEHAHTVFDAVCGALEYAGNIAGTWTAWGPDVQHPQGGRLVSRRAPDWHASFDAPDVEGMRRALQANLDLWASSLGLPRNAELLRGQPALRPLASDWDDAAPAQEQDEGSEDG